MHVVEPSPPGAFQLLAARAKPGGLRSWGVQLLVCQRQQSLLPQLGGVTKMLTRAEEEQEESWLPKKSEQLLGWYRVAAPPCLHPPLPLRTGSIPFCTTPPFFFSPFISPSPGHSCFGGWQCASRAAAMLILVFPAGDPGCGLSGSLSIPVLPGHRGVFCTRGFSCCTFQTATLGPWGLC